jgi:hypothetical protein
MLVPIALAIPAAKTKSATSEVATAKPKASASSTLDISATVLENSTASADSSASGGPSSIDYTHWDLQLPVGKPNAPETIPGSQLAKYSNTEYFYTQNGVVIMKVPGSPASTGCVHTPNSLHCRTELVERNPSTWDPKAATNRLTATLTVIKADDSKTGTCVGQIHIDDKVSSKPVAELYYNAQGDLNIGVEQTRSGGNEKLTKVTNVPLGTKFTYMIAYEKNELSVTINGGKKQVFSTYSLDAPSSYFKAGNYNQGNSASEVHFYGVSVQH